MHEPFIDNPKKMKEEYCIAKKYWDNLDFKKAAIHYGESIKFSGGNGINTNNFKMYYELGLIFCAYGDYRGATDCYSIATYLDKKMQRDFKEQYTKFEVIQYLPRGLFKLLIVSYSWQFGHACLDDTANIRRFPDWGKYVLHYKDFIKKYHDMLPFSYPDLMDDVYPKEVVDFYMKSGIEFAEAAMKLNDSEIEKKIDYILYTCIPTLGASLELKAEKGDPKAQYDLGKKYLKGIGVEQNTSKAVELIQKAALQGLAEAQVQLGDIFYRGVFVEKNVQKAFKYYANAYEQGNKDAEVCLERLLSECKNIAICPTPEYPATQKKVFEIMFKQIKKDNSKDVEKTSIEKSIIEREKDFIKEGVEAKRVGNYEKSIECYREAIRLAPETSETYFSLGKVLYIAGYYEEAFRAYTLAYLHDAQCYTSDLFMHAGHAVLDAENSKNPQYARVIKEYTATIKGEFPMIEGKNYQDYTEMCEAKGKEEILIKAKIHARD